MAALKYFNSDTIAGFLEKSTDAIMRHMVRKSPFSDNNETKDFWEENIVLTRSLIKTRSWLKEQACRTDRFGIMASIRIERLKAININVRYQPDFVHCFLDDYTDICLSNSFEDVLTEFKVQGLEIDWACVVWDADSQLSDNGKSCNYCKLGSKTIQVNGHIVRVCRRNSIKKRKIQLYPINAFRVRPTRAHQCMGIVDSDGDHGVPPNEKRKPECLMVFTSNSKD